MFKKLQNNVKMFFRICERPQIYRLFHIFAIFYFDFFTGFVFSTIHMFRLRFCFFFARSQAHKHSLVSSSLSLPRTLSHILSLSHTHTNTHDFSMLERERGQVKILCGEGCRWYTEDIEAGRRSFLISSKHATEKEASNFFQHRKTV